MWLNFQIIYYYRVYLWVTQIILINTLDNLNYVSYLSMNMHSDCYVRILYDYLTQINCNNQFPIFIQAAIGARSQVTISMM